MASDFKSIVVLIFENFEFEIMFFDWSSTSVANLAMRSFLFFTVVTSSGVLIIDD